MDQLREFLDVIRDQALLGGKFRGLLHLLVGRSIVRMDGTPVSTGMTWRTAAALLKKMRWDREAVRELGLDPSELPPRDREKFWYLVLSRSEIGSAEAAAQADALVEPLHALGYVVMKPHSAPSTQPAEK